MVIAHQIAKQFRDSLGASLAVTEFAFSACIAAYVSSRPFLPLQSLVAICASVPDRCAIQQYSWCMTGPGPAMEDSITDE